MTVKISYCDISMKKEIEILSRISPHTKDFAYCWGMWGHWKAGNFPIVAIHNRKIVGFNAPGYGLGVSYVDCYFQAVLPEYRGQGIAGGMLEFMFGKANELGIRRFRLRTDIINTDATIFWKGFGIRPFAKTDTKLFWDEDTRKVKDGKSLAVWMTKRKLHEPIPDRSMKRYKKVEGIKFLKRKEG